ncbi:MAG TPA: hypothetical protein VM677_06070 [Actinokineospora sp.]|nr:hypothetical protein [Actinokineospora sp.]
MMWALDRLEWALPPTMHTVVRRLEALVAAADSKSARGCAEQVETALVVGVVLQPGVAQVTEFLVQTLGSASAPARTEILELLFQLGGGAVASAAHDSELLARTRAEAVRGYPLYAHYLEHGDRQDQLTCVDLLWMCAAIDPSLCSRIRYLYVKAAELSEELRRTVAVNLPVIDEIADTRT